ncbi:1,4-alpha-glucan branching protein GlgB [Tepidibacillus fermentans]|uniref:1,4-alpha-glucan branching enzyme GlgB n=1 Tax=Tepidibacillus fermentans TaxID=1281767 RepID=A0A4R3KEL5_9BACI|nr:1,4-alpha-glucan branching protein GlgB [Tepidibacillus fermentans]TCS81081.1 1,4-alpha-glucan branching enzyme [Tepidibacillus fermentans]
MVDPLHPSETDLYLFHEGNLFHSYKMLGAHLIKYKGVQGARFMVWAPNARMVRVVGDFNQWNGERHLMQRINDSGLWIIFIPGLKNGDLYKYEIITEKEIILKADPYAFLSEQRPNTASIIYSLDGYCWNDEDWMQKKKIRSIYHQPLLIYEVHLGSWKKKNGEFYTYRELADELIGYVVNLGYTHIEILPIAEHPYDQSWGYQITGYYSITSRYGMPHDFMYFVDQCHQKGIGVILDWVPSHFAKDSHGLRCFDGTPLYEYADPKKAEKPSWGTLSFDYGKPEILSFLISNLIFFIKEYHIDGFRVDAVSSMLYLDFDKKGGEWVPNQYGGNENLEAISFLRKLNEVVFKYDPTTLMIAEESTAWPMVSAPTYLGGLGFNFKWNMGWMNDMLRYMEMDPIYRKYHHHLITFSFFYAFSENFILPLSHDEVVHGKRSLLNKMPGSYWDKFASLRLLYGYMMAHPGKKILFMGGEFAQFDEWKDQSQLDWNLLDFEFHYKMKQFVKELNHFYRRESALWELDHTEKGFEWIDPHDVSQSIITFMRKGKKKGDWIIVVCNFTPMVYEHYRIGVPTLGEYIEIFNTNEEKYGGNGLTNQNQYLMAEELKWHNQPYSLEIKISPLSCQFFKVSRIQKEIGRLKYVPKRSCGYAFSRWGGKTVRSSYK